MKKKGWILILIICICLLVFCIWKSQEFFSKASVTGEENSKQGEVTTVSPLPIEITVAPKPTEITATPKPTEIIATPEPTNDPDSGEVAEPVKDKMGDDLLNGTPTPTPEAEEPEKLEERYAKLREEIEEKIAQGVYEELDNKQYDWWFLRKKDHVPSGSGEEFDISLYNAYYLNKNVEDGDKVIYLTFDCGYENGFTPKILDTLAAHNAKAMFFVTKAFIKSRPEYVIRMKEEGHLVGNHTMNHPAMPKKDEMALVDEILGCAELLYETTGYKMDTFLRPPAGAYSERTLQLTKDLGYTTIFWSIAYKDYDVKNQPGKDYVTEHFETYYHSGAIPLIHNTSESNAEALDEVLTMLEEAGYRFGSLMELRQ